MRNTKPQSAIAASVIALLSTGCDPRDDANHPHDVQAWGYALTASCSDWLKSPETQAAGNEWVLGFWTGQNVRNVRDHEVGRTTDGEGILNEVKTQCAATPDERLASVAGRVYVNFERDRR